MAKVQFCARPTQKENLDSNKLNASLTTIRFSLSLEMLNDYSMETAAGRDLWHRLPRKKAAFQ